MRRVGGPGVNLPAAKPTDTHRQSVVALSPMGGRIHPAGRPGAGVIAAVPLQNPIDGSVR